MIRRCLFGASLIGLLASALLARQGTVTMSDGRVMFGDVQDSPDGKSINLTVHGATLTINRSLVSSINYPADAKSDYQQRLSALDPNDIKGRLDLSRFELNDRQYDLASNAAHDAERLDPHNPDAAILLDTIESQRALETREAQAVSPGAQESSTTQPSDGKYLSDADVYTIRLDELRPEDNVRVNFYNNVRQRFLGKYVNTANFYAETQAQQALDIFNSGDPNLSKDVRLASDPEMILQYRGVVQPRVLAGCAAAGCHGGDGAGGFMLYSDAKQARAAYTNFYILQKVGWKVPGGDTFGSGPVYRPMIDRVSRDSSLLLQFGLPRSLAIIPHPDVKNFKPIFTGVNDPAYIEISHWIGSLSPIAPDYGIKFEIPGHKAPSSQGS